MYDGHPASLTAYLDAVHARLPGDLNIFLDLKDPVYIHDNAYLRGARPYHDETHACVVAGHTPPAHLTTTPDGHVRLTLTLPEPVTAHHVPPVTTDTLEPVRIVGLRYDNPDSTTLTLDTDLTGHQQPGPTIPGPLHTLHTGNNTTNIW